MTVSVAVILLEVSAAHMQVIVFAINMWLTIFTVIMKTGVCYNYVGDIFCSALYNYAFMCIIMHVNVSGNNFILRSLTDSPSS